MGSIQRVPLRNDIGEGDQILHTSIKKEDIALIQLDGIHPH